MKLSIMNRAKNKTTQAELRLNRVKKYRIQALFQKKVANLFGDVKNMTYLCTRKNEKGSTELNSNIAEWSSW